MRASPPVLLVVLLVACGRPPVSAGDGDSASESSSATQSPDTTGADSFEDGTDGTEHSCGGFSIDPSFVPPNLMFVVDVSSSMLETWDHDDDPMTPEVSRWQSARGLLEQVVAEYGAHSHAPWLGLQRAPSIDACPGATQNASNCTDADVCVVESTPEVALGDAQGELILASLPDASASSLEIVGGSPIGAAYVPARDHLLAQSDDDDVRVIVLLTDGGANCRAPSLPAAVEVFDDGLAALVEDGFVEHEIWTVVVGVDVDEQQPSLPAQPDAPAVDTFAALNALALAGGTPWNGGLESRKFFDVREPDELMDLIVDGLISVIHECTVDLTMSPGGVPDPSQIPLVVIETDGEEVPYVLDCEQESGWTWVVDGEILTFCGSHCEAFKNGSAAFDIIYGCPPI